MQSIVAILAWIAFAALVAFIVLLWVRIVLEWVRVLQPRWRPAGVVLVIAELSFAVTDPPINVVRRVIKPIRIGGAMLDLGTGVVLIVCLILIFLIGPLRFV